MQWPLPNDIIASLARFSKSHMLSQEICQGLWENSKTLDTIIKTGQFSWQPEAQMAFDSLKNTMAEPLILTVPDFSKLFTIETNASNKGLGVVLL